MRRLRHPDDTSFFDEVKVELRERFKTSGLSGDEWRFSWVIRCYRKGRCLVERGCNGDAYAGVLAAEALVLGGELTMGHPRWDVVEKWDPDHEDGICCQPACTAPAVVRYRVVREYDRSCSLSRDYPKDGLYYREFCEKHAERGDGGLDDGPGNYVRLTSTEVA